MKILAVLIAVCMFVLNSCTRSDIPVQECYSPDTTGVKDTVVVWEEWAGGDGGLEWTRDGTDVSDLTSAITAPVNVDTVYWDGFTVKREMK